jgi:hypothetical protein
MHKKTPKKYDLMVILSGPEPQRGLLESILKIELKRRGDVVFIKGLLEDEHKEEQLKNIRYFNFTSRQLEQTFNESDIVLARSGYTNYGSGKTRQKPYPQPANMNNYTWQIKEEGLAPYAEQDDFKIDYLPQVKKSIVDCSTLTRP